MEKVKFDKVFIDVSAGNRKFKTNEYLSFGKLAVVDQGKDLIAGYVDDYDCKVNNDEPLIVFGDHTRCVKYIDFPFGLGADGIKVLKSKINANPKYLYYQLLTINIPNTGYNRHYKYLKEANFIIPTLAEQQKIADKLDQADKIRQLNRQLIEKYEALSQSLFLEMFGDPMKNEKGWEIVQIEKIASKEKHSIKAGPFGSSLKKEYYVDHGYKIYGQEQVIKNDIAFGDYYINESKFNELKNCQVKEGDVLISLVGTYGKILVIPSEFEPGIINPRLMKISPNKSIIRPDFLKFQLQSSYVDKQLKNFSRGGTMDIINVGIIKKVFISLPPLPLQNQFAERIAKIEQQKQLAQQELEKSEALFQSLLQQSFASASSATIN